MICAKMLTLTSLPSINLEPSRGLKIKTDQKFLHTAIMMPSVGKKIGAKVVNVRLRLA